MMLSLGQFAFSLSTLAYQSLQRSSAWRHAVNSRVGARAATQFVGPGDDTLHLSGVLYPDFMGQRNSLDTLRAMGAQGAAWPLVDGTGTVYGAWIIESINDTRTVFAADGTAKKIEFDMQLRHVDDSLVSGNDGYALGTTDTGAGMEAIA